MWKCFTPLVSSFQQSFILLEAKANAVLNHTNPKSSTVATYIHPLIGRTKQVIPLIGQLLLVATFGKKWHRPVGHRGFGRSEFRHLQFSKSLPPVTACLIGQLLLVATFGKKWHRPVGHRGFGRLEFRHLQFSKSLPPVTACLQSKSLPPVTACLQSCKQHAVQIDHS